MCDQHFILQALKIVCHRVNLSQLFGGPQRPSSHLFRTPGKLRKEVFLTWVLLLLGYKWGIFPTCLSHRLFRVKRYSRQSFRFLVAVHRLSCKNAKYVQSKEPSMNMTCNNVALRLMRRYDVAATSV